VDKLNALSIYEIKEKNKLRLEVTNARKVLPRGQNFGLGRVHYLYPGLVPKRNGLGKPFFCRMKGWVNIFLNKAYGWVNYFQYKPSIEQNMKIIYLTKWVIPVNIHSFPTKKTKFQLPIPSDYDNRDMVGLQELGGLGT
jgi:hypothetical protein